jgi:hypothetical protein
MSSFFSLPRAFADTIILAQWGYSVIPKSSLCSDRLMAFFSLLFPSLMRYLAEVETDGEGISSDSLRFILENWPVGKAKLKVLYTVPVSYFRNLHDAHQRLPLYSHR